MQFRRATVDDILEIMRIIAQGQHYLQRSRIAQWEGGYPSQNTIEQDIRQGNSYVLVQGDRVLGTTVLEFGADANYERIQEGTWLAHQAYGSIHRIAVDEGHKGRGLAAVMVAAMEEICLDRGILSLRVDTHKNNQSMQRMLQKTGFQYCGVIFLEDSSPRVAFEKILH